MGYDTATMYLGTSMGNRRLNLKLKIEVISLRLELRPDITSELECYKLCKQDKGSFAGCGAFEYNFETQGCVLFEQEPTGKVYRDSSVSGRGNCPEY